MAIYQIDPLGDPRWAELINRHPRASVFHTREWLAGLEQTYGFHPVVFTTCGPGKPLTDGVVLCGIRSWITGSRLVSLPFSDHCEPLYEEPRQFHEILDALRVEKNARGWNYVELRPVSERGGLSPEDDNFGAGPAFRFHVLDLTPELNAIFQACEKGSVQRKIRRAERAQLVYEEGRSGDLIAEFYKLLVLTRRRQLAPPQPMTWFRNLSSNLGEAFKARVVRLNGQAIASIVTLFHNQTMTYKYGCSDLRFSSLGGPAFLLWQTIQDAKSSGCRWLDLGRSDIHNAGLIRFKNNFGAAESSLNYLRSPGVGESSQSNYNVTVARRVACRLPDRLFVALGEVAYRHMA